MAAGSRAKTSSQPSCSTGAHHWSFPPFNITFQKQESGSPAIFRGEQVEQACLLLVCLDGEIRLNLARLGGCADMRIAPGDCALIYCPSQDRCVHCGQTHCARFLEMTCPAERLCALVGDTPLGRALTEAMTSESPLHVHRPTSPAMRRALDRLHTLSGQDSSRATPLVLSNMLEILWIFAHPEQQSRLSEQSLRAAREARSILESNMEQPPDLELLAARVGVSLSKLKQIFSQAYGMPPYTYLRMVRMERAMHLLRHKGLNVTETALEVGYSNLSHFSKVFVQYHGLKPSQVLKE